MRYVLGALLALVFAGAAVAQPVLTKQMVKPYNEAITAIQAKDYATAQTKITEAAAQGFHHPWRARGRRWG